MKSLLIDTSGPLGFIAVAEEGGLLGFTTLPQGPTLSKTFFPALKKLLLDCAVTPTQLAYVASGVGPGSYTGTRVGATAAKTIAFGRALPLVSFCSFKAFLTVEKTPTLYLCESKARGFYLFKEDNEDFISEFLSLPLLLPHLHQTEQIVGHDLKNLQERLAPHFEISSCKWQVASLNLEHLARIVEQKFLRGEYASDASLELIYLTN